MRTLVTGGAGFIGSNLADTLIERGADVTIVDDLSTGKPENIAAALGRGAELLQVDIRDAERLARAIGAARPDRIFHLAAQTDVRHSVADPAFDARTNVEGTINVLAAALRAGASRLVNISTGGAIYGEADVIPTDESTTPKPEAPYAQSKFAAEGYCRLFTRLHGLRTVTVRFANIYGPRQDPNLEAGVIAIFCGRLRGRRRPIVYGTGKQTRDYTYVGDAVEACIAASDADVGGCFNVGTGKETSVLDLVAALAPHAEGFAFEPEFAEPRPGELDRSCLDCGRAERELGWRARVDLAEGMRRTLAWHDAQA